MLSYYVLFLRNNTISRSEYENFIITKLFQVNYLLLKGITVITIIGIIRLPHSNQPQNGARIFRQAGIFSLKQFSSGSNFIFIRHDSCRTTHHINSGPCNEFSFRPPSGVRLTRGEIEALPQPKIIVCHCNKFISNDIVKSNLETYFRRKSNGCPLCLALALCTDINFTL